MSHESTSHHLEPSANDIILEEDQSSKKPLNSSNRGNYLDKLRGWYNKDRFSARKGRVHSLMMFLETTSVWIKATVGVLVVAPLIIAGSLIPLFSLLVVGGVIALLWGSVTGILEYYKYRHQTEKQQMDKMQIEVDESLEALRLIDEEEQEYRSTMDLNHKALSKSFQSVGSQKTQLEGTLKELRQRNLVINTMNEGLSIERDALRTIVSEKDKKHQTLSDEIKQLNRDKQKLKTDCTELTKQHASQMLHATREKVRLKNKIYGLYKQRHFLVDKINQQRSEIDALTEANEQLIQERDELRQRVVALNVTLLNQLCKYKEVTSTLTQMGEEIGAFKKNNTLMAEQIKVLVGHKEALSTNISALNAIEKELRASKQSLEVTVKELSTQSNEQRTLLLKQQQQMHSTMSEYEANKKILNKTLIDLEQTKKTMAQEIEQLKAAQGKLVTLVNQFSTQVVADKDQKQAFMDRLTAFLDKKEAPMERFIQGVQELSDLASGFQTLNARHDGLVTQHEQLLASLHKVVAAQEHTSRVSELSMFKGMSGHSEHDSTQQEISIRVV